MTLVAAMVTGRPAGQGPLIGRLRGQQLARRELARAFYRPSLLSRLWHDLTHWLGSLLSTSPSGSPAWWGLILLALALAAAVAVVLYMLGPASVTRRLGTRAVLDTAHRSAAAHRDAADRLAASGNYSDAIVERMRAIAVDLEDRDILLRRPARTAGELAAEASAVFAAEAAELADAARRFDDVRYGGRTGTGPGYRQIRDLDIRLTSAAPVPSEPHMPDAILAGRSRAAVAGRLPPGGTR